MLAKELLLLSALFFQGGFLVCLIYLISAPVQAYVFSVFISVSPHLQIVFLLGSFVDGRRCEAGEGLRRGEMGTLEHWQWAFPSQPR